MTSPVQRSHVREQIWEALWLRTCIETTFSSCSDHEGSGLKRYCVDCNIPACLQCIREGTHMEHRVLKIHTYSTKKAVLQSEITEHIDCSEIQAFIWNRVPVLGLKPFPHHGTQNRGEGACVTCTRPLPNANINRYCSLSCKLKAFLEEENDSGAPPQERIEMGNPPQERTGMENPPQQRIGMGNPPQQRIEMGNPPQERIRKRSRKGVPHRAPFT